MYVCAYIYNTILMKGYIFLLKNHNSIRNDVTIKIAYKNIENYSFRSQYLCYILYSYIVVFIVKHSHVINTLKILTLFYQYKIFKKVKRMHILLVKQIWFVLFHFICD